MPYEHHLKQPNDRGFPRPRFPYSLHCKNAAISAPANLNRSSHIEPRNIQITSTIAIQIVIVVSVFCDMRFTPYRRGANLSLVKVDTVRASVKQKCLPGLFHIWPLANLRPASKAPAGTLLLSPPACKHFLSAGIRFLKIFFEGRRLNRQHHTEQHCRRQQKRIRVRRCRP